MRKDKYGIGVILILLILFNVIAFVSVLYKFIL